MLKINKVKFVAAILITAIFAQSSCFALASTLTDKKNELNSVNKQIEQTRAKIKEAEKKEKELVVQIKDSDKRLNDLTQELEQLSAKLNGICGQRSLTEAELDQLQKEMMKTNSELELAEYDLERQQNTYDERLTNMYKKGDAMYYEVVLGVSGFSDLVSRLSFLNLIIQSDKDLLDSINKSKAIVEEKKIKIEEQQSLVKDKRAVLISQQHQVEEVSRSVAGTKQQVAGEQKNKQQLLGKVQQDKESYIRMEREQEQASQEIARMIRALESSRKNRRTPINSTGIFIWPVSGYITSDFGNRTHPIFKVTSFHSGIDIGASSGTSIKAADSGEVMYAGWRGGYGRTVIIDHGSGETSLYGHCSSLNVSEGQTINKGDIIASVGSTGYSTGPHLHFEIRVDGEPQDPMGWL